MRQKAPTPPARGLDGIERALFAFGVLAFALLMAAFGGPLGDSLYPVLALWIVGGLAFIWWFDRHLAGGA